MASPFTLQRQSPWPRSLGGEVAASGHVYAICTLQVTLLKTSTTEFDKSTFVEFDDITVSVSNVNLNEL